MPAAADELGRVRARLRQISGQPDQRRAMLFHRLGQLLAEADQTVQQQKEN
jgi:hypothetical protein